MTDYGRRTDDGRRRTMDDDGRRTTTDDDGRRTDDGRLTTDDDGRRTTTGDGRRTTDDLSYIRLQSFKYNIGTKILMSKYFDHKTAFLVTHGKIPPDSQI